MSRVTSIAKFDDRTESSAGLSSTGASAKSLTSQAYERLREDIITCKLKPNEPLRINTMADQYEVGATAIREALSRLVTEGLVDAFDQRGFCVAPVSREDLLDLTNTRTELEQLAISKAVASGSIDWEAKVIAAFHRLSRRVPESLEKSSAPEWREWRDLHRQFHAALVDGSGSRWLSYLCALLYDRSERYRNLAGMAAGKLKPARRDVMAEHKGMVDAVLAHDAALIHRLIREHLQETLRGVLRAAEAAPQIFGDTTYAAEMRKPSADSKVPASSKRKPGRPPRR
jgi:GntR family transcriptional regulator, carbon starvation induced regulator